MAEATIDSLQLEISSSSDGASQGLAALSKSLKKLQSVTSKGLGLTAVVNELKAADTGISSSLGGLTKAVDLLSKLGGVKISASIGNQLTAISTALQGANFSGGQAKINELVTALEPLKTIGRTNLTSTVNALKKLPDALNNLDTRTLYTKIQSLTRIFKPLADEMQKVANGFSAFPAKIQRLITGTDKLTASNNKASTSYINLYAKIKMAMAAVKGVANKIAGWIKLSSDYTETMNLFTVSMGQYAKAAYDYAQQVSDVMGIDPKEWMQHQGVFMTLTKGFGVAGDRADKMSQQLTQLGYDLSSFFNIRVEDAMTKLESGIAGELEPLRRLGYDLSQAKLEATALSLGIDKAVSSMTQAEKAELRYYAIMTQVTDAHQDMSRTLNAPANQLRVLQAQVTLLGRTLGNFFIPLLNQVLPYAIACVKVLREALTLTMGFLGIELSEVDFGSDSLTSATNDIVTNLEDGQDEAKKLKSYMLGFDELNVLNTDDGTDNPYDTGFNFDLPTYDFITEGVVNRADALLEDAKEILTTVGSIATGLAAWTISTKFLKALKEIKKITGKKINWGNLLSGAALFMQDLTTMQEYLEDFAENGATFEAVTGILSTFTGMIGDVMITLGKTEIGGALKVVEGVGQIVSEVAKMSKEGVNADGLLGVCNGLSNIVIGIGALTKNWKLMGVGMTLQGITTIIDEISDNWEAIKKGDWSGVDIGTMAIAAIEIIAGIVTALGVFNNVKKATDTAKAAKEIADVSTTVTEISTTTSTLTTKLTTLVKNLGLGIAIIAEVAVAAGLIIAAIWGLGELLEETGKAWQPVIDNGTTVLTAVGIGTGILVAIGVASAAIGTLGAPMIANIALGTAMLALMGVNATLFLAEILVVGKLLDEIGTAWKPVLDNGDTIKNGIAVGTGLLVAIGIVSAALGVATVASVGLLPLAIALGAALLAELAVAFGVFCDSLSDVATDITNLAPKLSAMNDVLPDLASNMSDFTTFMGDFAGKAAKFSVSSAIAGIAATIDKVIDFFTTDPIKRMSDNVKKQYEQAKSLYDELVKAIPKIKDATTKMKEFNDAIDKFEGAAGTGSNKNGIIGYIFEFAVNIKDSASAWTDLKNGATNAWNGVKSVFSSVGQFFQDTFKGAWEKVKGVFSTGGQVFEGITNGIVIGFKAIVNMIIKGINNVVAIPFNAINTALTTIRDIKFLNIQPFKNVIKTITVPQIPLLAQGGFPETGQMFIAREAGAELVGNIGGRSAVMNNDQIVESVSAGVYQAVLAALGGNNEEGGETNIVINLDGEKIYENQQKIARGRGYNLGMGAFSFG